MFPGVNLAQAPSASAPDGVDVDVESPPSVVEAQAIEPVVEQPITDAQMIPDPDSTAAPDSGPAKAARRRKTSARARPAKAAGGAKPRARRSSRSKADVADRS